MENLEEIHKKIEQEMEEENKKEIIHKKEKIPPYPKNEIENIKIDNNMSNISFYSYILSLEFEKIKIEYKDYPELLFYCIFISF